MWWRNGAHPPSLLLSCGNGGIGGTASGAEKEGNEQDVRLSKTYRRNVETPFETLLDTRFPSR
jgi:hypothetical protein